MDTIWQAYQTDGYPIQTSPVTAREAFYLALIAFAHDDIPAAQRWTTRAAEFAPGSLVYRHGKTYLQRVDELGKNNVYVDSEAFAIFVRGGGNVSLYVNLNNALRKVYEEHEAMDLLDIGVGDGLALLPALTDSVQHIDLVEPSLPLLRRTCAELDRSFTVFNTTIQHFSQKAHAHWQVAQATFSLQNMAPDDRVPVYEWLREHCDCVLIAEFDVPLFETLLHPSRVRYIVDRYEQGLAEYKGDVVAQGFLLPVLFAYFNRSAANSIWESPIDEWVAALDAAGFDHVKKTMIFDYWWADAYLIDAR